MESILQVLITKANAANLDLVTSLTSKEELLALDKYLNHLEDQINDLGQRLDEEEKTLNQGIAAASDIIRKVKGRPLASAMKGSRNVTYTPNPMSTPGRKVSFDVKHSSPLFLTHTEIMSPGMAPAIPLATVCTKIHPLTQTEFDQIPKYMKGRTGLDKINLAIALLNQLFDEKYAIMSQNPNKLPHEFRQRYWDWKELECDEVMDRRFITEADIKTAMQNAAAKGAPAVFKLDPLGRSVLAILRHHGRIREVRTPGVVRFVIL